MNTPPPAGIAYGAVSAAKHGQSISMTIGASLSVTMVRSVTVHVAPEGTIKAGV